LPRSASRRGQVTYCKLLRAARPNRTSGGWDLDGELLRPGATLKECELWPAADYPEVPLLLECAGSDGSGWGHPRAPCVYILWRWEQAAGAWRELARAASVNRDWTEDLGPIAKRQLEPPRPVLVDPRAAVGRMMATLEHELEPLDRQAQRVVLLAAYDQVAARVVEG